MLPLILILVLGLMMLSFALSTTLMIARICFFPIKFAWCILMMAFGMLAIAWRVAMSMLNSVVGFVSRCHTAYCRWYDRHYAYRNRFNEMVIQ